MDTLHLILVAAGVALVALSAGTPGRFHWHLRRHLSWAWRVPRPLITWVGVALGALLLFAGLMDLGLPLSATAVAARGYG